jgi:glycerophosphoryl diester phosphodiesterase
MSHFVYRMIMPAGLLLLSSIGSLAQGIDRREVPVISGHRGGAVAGYPENCIATFEHTLHVTPAMFEIDPHLTKDSGIVLLHDASLERITTGWGKLNDYTLKEVRKFSLKDGEGAVTSYHLSTLEEAVKWCKGKALLNLDVKDVPLVMKAALVKRLDAFGSVMFTVHSPSEARFFYDFDHRSCFSAWIQSEKELKEYEAAGIPWANVLIAYVGPLSKKENQGFYALLHRRGVKVMVSAAPTYDKEGDPEKRAEAYRQILKDGADVIESDRPIEVAAAIKNKK